MTESYLDSKRISGTTADRNGIPAVSGGWKELGRTTLGSANAATTVSSLADKRYYMILHNGTGYSGFGNCEYRLGNSTIDTGSNYASRESNNGAIDTPRAGQPSNYIGVGYQDYDEDFSVSHVSNLASKEKLIISHNVAHDGTGASNAPERNETVGKWAKTGNPLMDIFSRYNSNGTQAIGSELVVLGWDPEDTHTTNFWEELASVNTGAGEVLDSGTFAAKKYLWFQFDIVVDTFNNTNATIRFNSDQNGNYARRLSQNGMATDSTAAGQTHMTFTWSGGKRVFGNYFVINNSSSEKLAIGHTNAIGTAANSTSEGAGVAPRRVEVVGKWANISSQITQIEVLDTAQGDLGLTSGTIKVWGSD